jgi:hypothetical protein
LFHELEHYGFIVMVKPGGLGVEGRGRAPHWRLTEEWYLGKAPTRDFLNWTGEVFSKPRRLRKKSVWPVRHGSDSLYATGCTVTENIPKKTRQPVRHGSDIYGPKPVRHVADITSLTTPFGERGLRTDGSEDVVVPIGDTAGKLRWSKPQPIEITDPGVLQRFRLGPRCA